MNKRQRKKAEKKRLRGAPFVGLSAWFDQIRTQHIATVIDFDKMHDEIARLGPVPCPRFFGVHCPDHP